MKRVCLIHNPGAGNEEHSKKELISTIEGNGFQCRYSSTKGKKAEKEICKADIVAVAGGDGTVRKTAKKLLSKKLRNKTGPIGLIPLGTANNISKSLELPEGIQEIINGWKENKSKAFDVGRIYNIKGIKFFLEALGFGIFPYLMRQMEKTGKEEIEEPELKLKETLKLLHKIIVDYKARLCKLNIDGTDHSGKYIMAEILNIPSFGPNLQLAPTADPGDGQFEVVLIPEHLKDNFASYVMDKINDIEDPPFEFERFKGKSISIQWEGTHLHVDDEFIKFKKNKQIDIVLKEGLLQFLI